MGNEIRSPDDDDLLNSIDCSFSSRSNSSGLGLIRSYEGIPENLVLNFIVASVVIFLEKFECVKQSLDHEILVSVSCFRFLATSIRRLWNAGQDSFCCWEKAAIWEKKKQLQIVLLLSAEKFVLLENILSNQVLLCSERKIDRKTVSFFSDQQIYRRCSTDAFFYLLFQKYLIFYLVLVTIFSLGVILPLNLSSSQSPRTKTNFPSSNIQLAIAFLFQQTSEENLVKRRSPIFEPSSSRKLEEKLDSNVVSSFYFQSSSLLWLHGLGSLLFVVLGIFVAFLYGNATNFDRSNDSVGFVFLKLDEELLFPFSVDSNVVDSGRRSKHLWWKKNRRIFPVRRTWIQRRMITNRVFRESYPDLSSVRCSAVSQVNNLIKFDKNRSVNQRHIFSFWPPNFICAENFTWRLLKNVKTLSLKLKFGRSLSNAVFHFLIEFVGFYQKKPVENHRSLHL